MMKNAQTIRAWHVLFEAPRVSTTLEVTSPPVSTETTMATL